ncbi:MULTISPECIES: serine hydrolase [Thermomonosporaceae]|uniref:serine hydrolase n=1 Tax=Thermomonosporaceae TaxID=2012 RepID=UPI00255B3384|nr:MULTISPECIES: serine hydrolase [Thermomonosporaceae]MDL4777713.1 serine hydrolase [Actinomadura xylanilytica]
MNSARVANTRAGTVGGQGEVTKVAERLRLTMDRLRFQDVLDMAPPESAQARSLANPVDKEARKPRDLARLFSAAADPKPIVQQPQIDATVIELDRKGRPVSSGTVLMSPKYQHGIVVPVDRNLSTEDVRWRQWDDAGWYANKGQGTVDVVPGRENAPVDHMLAYPASVLKLMVNFGVLRLVDQGVIKLDQVYDYKPTEISSLCGEASSKTVRQYMDASLTYSSNAASCALVKLLHDHKAVDPLNQTFQDLGLRTLQLKDTNPVNGGHWGNAVTMSSLDTAKLLTLINGVPGRAWTAPNGKPVTSAVLSAASRRVFQGLLKQQGFNDMLSSTNWCGGNYPAPGLPNAAPSRWVGADGTVTVDGNKFGRDVRPCNKKAEVSFAHKTGWVNNTASEAGIVKALPGKGGRSYIVAVFSNLGTQYTDARRPASQPGAYPFSYTEKFAQLGRIVDTYEKRRVASQP